MSDLYRLRMQTCQTQLKMTVSHWKVCSALPPSTLISFCPRVISTTAKCSALTTMLTAVAAASSRPSARLCIRNATVAAMGEICGTLRHRNTVVVDTKKSTEASSSGTKKMTLTCTSWPSSAGRVVLKTVVPGARPREKDGRQESLASSLPAHRPK